MNVITTVFMNTIKIVIMTFIVITIKRVSTPVIQSIFTTNLFIFQARESSVVPAGFLTAQFLQKTLFMKLLFLWEN